MRLIDADKLQQFPIRANRCDKEHANKHFLNGIESVMEYAEQLPTVDAEVVVRCKNCTSGTMSDDNKYIICCRLGVGMELDDFCSSGERKEGKTDA